MIPAKRRVQFVVKTSKFCNLRCRYCYEYAELGNKKAIALAQVADMFRNIASLYQNLDAPTDIQFVWHGGEPLLQSPDFYWQTFELQKQIFGELSPYISNAVQTNLTVLDKPRLDLLKNGFDGVGISLDLFSGLRVNAFDKDSQPTVIANMDKLRDAGIDFGGITVLTKLNLPYLTEIYNFYKKMQLSVRILPLFNGAFAEQHLGYEIDAEDTLQAYKTLVDLWFADDEFVMVLPIIQYIQQVLHMYDPNARSMFYDKSEWESIYLVNTTGDLYSYADAYDLERSHGNIFTTSLQDLVIGERHQKVIEAANYRIMATCQDCPFFGACSGYPVAEESVGYNMVDEKGVARCVVEKGILRYIEYRLIEAGLIDSSGRLTKEILLPQVPAGLSCNF
jgi:uncharacterized protein